MRMHKKRIARYGTALICAFGVALSSMSVHAEDIESLENKTSNLQDQLDGINQDMVEISDKIAETEAQIEESNNEVFRLEASLQISRNNEEKQYDNMKSRIKYMYENGSETMISMLFSADSMADFLNKADFVQNVTEYDRDMLENLVEVREGIETQEDDLKKQQQELADLKEQLNSEQAELQAKADATSTDLATFNAQLQAARDAKAKEEEAAEASKNTTASSNKNNSSSSNTNSGSNSSSNSNSGNNSSNSNSGSNSGTNHGNYVIPSGGLTPSKGRIWFNGHSETYYSQKVLPGGGLAIPGRHIASDGTIRDRDNYIVVASDDYPKGTVVQTSLGAGKVYDTGSGKGNIDLYTDW
jgi:peptidoglycan hydrolase CwlO-like protein